MLFAKFWRGQSLGESLQAGCIYLTSTAGVFGWYEALSLTMIKNALASLTQSGLILQPSRLATPHATPPHVTHPPCSEVEGRDRLVKVAKQDKLTKLADELGQCSLGNQFFVTLLFLS